MHRGLLLVVIFFFLHSVLSAQPYPRYYFRNPLGFPMQLTANFGELRFNHWHMGLDMRTNQKENQPIYAAAAGFIARVKIEPFGFGRSIFIEHPNGMTTVYGHLNDFFPALEQYVTEQQYKQESWSIELDIPKDKFKVFKSQFIANSGNSGASQGPHLHFEIRDTKTGKSLNPLLFGFPLSDNIPPEVLKLAMYDRSRSVYDQSPQLFSLKKTIESYTIPNVPIIYTGLNKISFAIQALDRITGSRNPNGIYAAKIYFDENPLVSFELDSINYSESSYINAQIDYKHLADGGVKLQHLSILPGDRGTVYKRIKGDGTIILDDSDIHAVLIEVKDAYMNTSLVSFNIQYVDSLSIPVPADVPVQKFAPNKINVLKKNDFELEMPAACLYDTVQLQYSRYVTPEQFAVSALHIVNDASIPVHTNFIVRIKPDRVIHEAWKNKLLIQRNFRSSVRKAVWQGDPTGVGWLTAKFDDFGSFQLFADTLPPEIDELLNGGNINYSGDTIDLSPAERIVFRLKDNFGVIKNLRAELNGRWVRFSNDKGSAYIYHFDERCPYGLHELKVTAEDLAGNLTTKTWWFKRNPYTPPPKKKPVQKKKTIQKKTSSKKNQ